MNMKYTIKIYKQGKLVSKSRTKKKRRFLNIIRTINWQERGLKVYLKVDYGKFLDNYGKMSDFWNDGDYYNKDDFWLAFNAFTEDD